VVAVAAVVGLYVLASRSDDGSSSTTARPPVAQSATGGQALARAAATQPQARKKTKAKAAAPKPKVERIVVRGGKPVGGLKRLEFERGERVRFSVQSDSADEVHVHGFDLEKAVPANRRVRFGFPADIEGVFEVELHSTHTKIAELRIRP
jgi:hypothetical protein